MLATELFLNRGSRFGILDVEDGLEAWDDTSERTIRYMRLEAAGLAPLEFFVGLGIPFPESLLGLAHVVHPLRDLLVSVDDFSRLVADERDGDWIGKPLVVFLGHWGIIFRQNGAVFRSTITLGVWNAFGNAGIDRFCCRGISRESCVMEAVLHLRSRHSSCAHDANPRAPPLICNLSLGNNSCQIRWQQPMP